ncbi:MAG: hypothetical protein JSR28_15800 [Proteobacteria bacterium]|nr:hypothetical protein [Pseudomonadota bacterium]
MGKFQSQEGPFIQVVGTLDLDKEIGEILYVNPASSAILPDEDGREPRAVLEVLSRDGMVLEQVHPALQVSSCQGDEADSVALIQEYLPAREEASMVRLRMDDKVLATWEAGVVSAPGDLQLSAESMETASGHAGPKLKLSGPAPKTSGITYSIQARLKHAKVWSTLAVGRASAEVVLDSNQFPGQAEVEVRVLRTDGFTDSEVSRKMIQLKK